MFIYFGKTWLWCAFFKEKSLLAEMGCLRLKFRKRKSKTLSGQWSDAECMGDVLLRTGMKKHQELLPTSTCCCFLLKRFLVLESGYLTWWVETLLFLWKLFPAVKQNICFLMNGSVSCEFVFCLLLSSGHFCATDSYGWLPNQILVIAPTPTPARLAGCSDFALDVSMEPESSPFSRILMAFWRQDFYSKGGF